MRANDPVTIAIVAGEASGDLLASHFVEAVKKRLPHAHFVGIAGPKMIAAGVKALYPTEKLAVRGYAEALLHLPSILLIRARFKRYLLRHRPTLFVGVDAPDFNLGLEMALKKNGIPTMHYISPSIWAWRGERIEKIRAAVDQMLLVFPFEAKLYEKAGISARYVGHPLADLLGAAPDQAEARRALGFSQNETIVALLPGSRSSELHFMARLFCATAARLLADRPDLRFVVPMASAATLTLFQHALAEQPAAIAARFSIFDGKSHLALRAANVALIASGTATLEAALLRCPMVITYKMSPLSYKLMRRKAYLPYVGLPNILAERFVVPEILQDDATPQNLAMALAEILADPVRQSSMSDALGALASALRQDGSSQIGDAVSTFISNHAPG